MTIPQIYESKEKAIYPKTEFIDGMFAHLLCEEKKNEEWIAVALKAPTRDTVMNWCTGATKPNNPLYLKSLSEYLDIPVIKLFD